MAAPRMAGGRPFELALRLITPYRSQDAADETMFIPTACMSCGFPVGDFAHLFKVMREELLAKQRREGVPVANLGLDPLLQVNCEGIFAQLASYPAGGSPRGEACAGGVETPMANCCRKTLATTLDFLDYA
jgi:hypothetical protein